MFTRAREPTPTCRCSDGGRRYGKPVHARNVGKVCNLCNADKVGKVGKGGNVDKGAAATMKSFTPKDLDEVQQVVREANSRETHLDLRGAGTMRHMGRVAPYDAILDVGAMSGIIDYEPEELILTVRAATPLAEVETALSSAGQMLAFEPPNMTAVLGGKGAKSTGTIGGAVAANLSGPRRLVAGAARDFVLGFNAVSGRGERFKSGGRVVKNVTGYDLSKLMCGSFGTLAVMDEITLKTLPAPETSVSLVVGAQSYREAAGMISRIMATPCDAGAVAILPKDIAKEEGVDVGKPFCVVVRFEGFEASVADRLAGAREGFGGDEIKTRASRALWARLRDVNPLADAACDIWKVSCAPSHAWRVIETIDGTRETNLRYFADWAGGLLWVGCRSHDTGRALRRAVKEIGGGFAMLVRDLSGVRERIEPFQPLDGGFGGLARRIKTAFDPAGVLNYERMHQGC